MIGWSSYLMYRIMVVRILNVHYYERYVNLGFCCRQVIDVYLAASRPINQLFKSGMSGLQWMEVCRKCAVRSAPMCANLRLFNTELDCFRAGLIVGKLLMFNGAQTRKTLSD
jgi:hypothetical protein